MRINADFSRRAIEAHQHQHQQWLASPQGGVQALTDGQRAWWRWRSRNAWHSLQTHPFAVA